MNIEKTECKRLGNEYKDLLEQINYALHYISYLDNFIGKEGLQKFSDLSLRIATGECEIIQFERTLCRFDVDKKIKEEVYKAEKEKDKEIEKLNKELEARKQLINKQDKELWTLEHIIKEVIEYAKELRLFDNESTEFEISNDLFRIVDKEVINNE